MKKLLKLLFSRLVLVIFLLLIEAALLVLMVLKFEEYFIYFYAVCVGLSLICTVRIINDRSNPGYKIAWLVPVLLIPVFGVLCYLLFGGSKLSKFTKRRMAQTHSQTVRFLDQDSPVLSQIGAFSETARLHSNYLQRYAYCPPYQNTRSVYFSCGEEKFEALKRELAAARYYIFLEYFIIEEGLMWGEIFDILKQKASEGVDVRLIYDDMGCIRTLPYHFDRKVENSGVQCRVFNPFVPVLTSKLNNRDHRKICVIDGHTGFTGGINLADEYINAYEKHGHWKDSAVMLKGDAVWTLTVLFLSMWDYINGTTTDYSAFAPQVHAGAEPSDGFVQPYADSPLDFETVGENLYLNMINRARHYIYITTPYLIIDNEMITALCNAAKSGVAVKIITPHIADKRIVYAVTQAYYPVLVEAGVEIYEYTPGFIHAKNVVVDGEYATVGTINFDYRSLYLHFECGCYFYHSSCIADIERDYQQTLAVSRQVTKEDCRGRSWIKRTVGAILKIFAPLM